MIVSVTDLKIQDLWDHDLVSQTQQLRGRQIDIFSAVAGDYSRCWLWRGTECLTELNNSTNVATISSDPVVDRYRNW